MTAIVYGPLDRRTLLTGSDAQITLNIHIQESFGGIARSLQDTDIADVCSLDDDRLPTTLEEFDQRYPPPE